MAPSTYAIAGWRFDPAEPVLRNGVRECRLEDRAARTLEMLCEHRGEVVSKEALIARVWNGRTVSDNSVSIVIGMLRRAIEDDPQQPLHIVTVARRGYRLVDAPPLATTRRSVGLPHRGWLLWGAGLAAVVGGAMILRPSPAPPVLAVEPPRNETGQAALDELAVSLAPVVIGAATHLAAVRVVDIAATRSSDVAPRIILRSRLILWGGVPELALAATDTRTRAVIWTAFAAGPSASLARNASARIATLGASLPR